ncbi:hypothetical protein ACF073_27980 [Streptomyces sp. NPDC015171]|uniref:hypothetical protein n=1 Tax=Streptomyces sp. NPDC015171 TaxID=3364945 RepID=UPI0036F72356
MSLCLAAAAAVIVVPVAVLVSPVAPDVAHADTTPSCAGTDTRDFPLTARIRGGPESYEAGGGRGTWYIDLTNGTRRTCAGVHPVVVLVDDQRALRPNQPHLDFSDGSRTRPVTFESTDEQELVGVLDGAGFAGFTVPPGRTVSVRVRLALASDTALGQVTASAAVVQRRGQDGDWVGESNAYRFGVEEKKEGGKEEKEEKEDAGERDGDAQEVQESQKSQESQGTQESQQPRQPLETRAAQDASGIPVVPSAPGAATPASAPPGTATDPDSAPPYAAEAADAGERARELARTGPGLAHGLVLALALLLGAAGGAFLLARGRRR